MMSAFPRLAPPSPQRRRCSVDEHQHALEEIGPGHRHEAARERVRDDDGEAHEGAQVIVPVQEAVERLAGRIDLGAHVDRDEQRERHRGEEAQGSRRPNASGAAEPAHQEIGNRDRLEAVRRGLEGSGHEEPGDRHADELAHDDPERPSTDQRTEAREAEIQPRRLSAGPGGEGDHPVAETFPADVVVGEIAHPATRERTDREQHGEVDSDGEVLHRVAGAELSSGPFPAGPRPSASAGIPDPPRG
jgi:hypothetical protein